MLWEHKNDWGRAWSAYEAAKKGAGDPVLYLDFDGVLCHDNVLWHPKRGPYLQAPEGHSLFQHAPLLEQLVGPYPGIRIVLSTSWVLRYRCAGAAKRLPVGLQVRVIGATYHSEMWKEAFQAMPRWKQIWNDVLRRNPGSGSAREGAGRSPTAAAGGRREVLTLDDYLVPDDPNRTFLARVKGDSMRDAALVDGDLVVVQKNCPTKMGDIG